MAKAAAVDTRKLKDDAAEALKKQRWEKAADTLEKLVAAEPKDMQHRLRLGDAYRRMEQVQKSIAAYQHVARHYADEGQLIKAIGAVKIILEIDPKNGDAQQQLAEMNQRRFGKAAAPAAAAPAPVARIPVAQRPVPVEEAPAHELPEDEGEVLEVDTDRDARNVASPIALVPPAPDLASPGLDDDLDVSLVGGNAGSPMTSPILAPPPDPAVGLPDDILAPAEPEPLPVDDDDVEIESEEEIVPERAVSPRTAPIVDTGEIEIETTPAPGRTARPIADLLSSDAEEEIELFSTASEEPAAKPAAPPADDLDLTGVFQSLPEPGKAPVPVMRVPLFDDLSQDAFVELVNKLTYQRYAPGELILREGDPGHSFYVIASGKVRIYKKAPDGSEIKLAHLDEGAFFGEMALLSGAPRTANVVAELDTEVLEVSDVVLRDLAANHPPVVKSLKNFYRQRLLNNVMAISPLFRDFDPAERKSIVGKFRMKQAAGGDVLIQQGDSSDGLYVVLHGAVDVRRTATASRCRSRG
jgi:CRP-like cAMP-binding protein